MTIKPEHEGVRSVLHLEGRIDAHSAPELESAIRKEMEEGFDSILLNMSDVHFVASAGLRVVLIIAKDLRQKGSGCLRLAALQPNVKKVFEISGLVNFLNIHDNLEDAKSADA